MKDSKLKTEKRDMILGGSLIKVLMFLAVPIVINNFIQTMYNLTDTFWLGMLGSDPIAAITVVTPIQTIIVNFGQGITLAGSILISQYIGAMNEKGAKIMAHQIFFCSMIFSVTCAAICFFATPALISWLGATGTIYEFSKTYLQIVVLDMPFLFMINLYTAVNQAQGNTVSPMYLNLLGIILNMILDPLFLMVFKWGVAGAAISTVLAKVPCAIIAFMSITDKKKKLHITLSEIRPDKEKLLKIFKLGLPTAIGGSTMQFGFLLMSKNVLEYGPLAVAAYGVGNRINSIITMPSNAMGSATATIVGQNLGAGQVPRAEKAYKTARNITVVALFILGMILSREVVSTSLVKIFLHNPPNATAEDIENVKQTILWCSDFLSIMAFWCWTNAIYNTTNALFQASGHTLVTMIIDASRIWIFRFVTLYVCEEILHLGVRSIWYCVVVSNGLSAFILLALYHMKFWKKDTLNIRKQPSTE